MEFIDFPVSFGDAGGTFGSSEGQSWVNQRTPGRPKRYQVRIDQAQQNRRRR
jgi:hypothetical protein